MFARCFGLTTPNFDCMHSNLERLRYNPLSLNFGSSFSHLIGSFLTFSGLKIQFSRLFQILVAPRSLRRDWVVQPRGTHLCPHFARSGGSIRLRDISGHYKGPLSLAMPPPSGKHDKEKTHVTSGSPLR